MTARKKTKRGNVALSLGTLALAGGIAASTLYPHYPALPDPKLTPGATDPRVTQDNIAQTICHPGYTKTVRPPVKITNRIKHQVMKAYGFPNADPKLFELDHLISLELGGCPDCVTNLWPEAWSNGDHGAKDKDKVENALHALVCDGHIKLADAQHAIASNWETALETVTGDPADDEQQAQADPAAPTMDPSESQAPTEPEGSEKFQPSITPPARPCVVTDVKPIKDKYPDEVLQKACGKHVKHLDILDDGEGGVVYDITLDVGVEELSSLAEFEAAAQAYSIQTWRIFKASVYAAKHFAYSLHDKHLTLICAFFFASTDTEPYRSIRLAPPTP